MLAGLSGTLSSLVFLLCLMLFLSVDAAGIERRLAAVAADRPQLESALRSFAHGTRSYLLVTTVFGLIVGVLDAAALAVIGVPLPVLWGVLSFMTNYIPNVGFIIGLIPPALLALLTLGVPEMFLVIAVYCVLNFVIQSLIQPHFVGDSVGLAMTTTFVALVFWAWLLGPLGALLAIPLTLLVKALLVDVDPAARWATALAGSLAPEPREPRRRRVVHRDVPRGSGRGCDAAPDGRSRRGHLHPARRMSAAWREVIVEAHLPTPERAMPMTTLDRARSRGRSSSTTPGAPPATVVVPSVFVAARWLGGQLLLVRRCDSGCWELPGGRVDVGENAVDAAVRETAEEAGVQVLITGFAGLFSDPGHVVRSPDGEVRQQFAVLLRARPLRGVPRGDMHETSEAAWVAPIDIPGLDVEPAARVWIDQALSVGDAPYLG